MTDNEIIKAAEWCWGCTSDKCRNCPLEDTAFCEEKLQDEILDLINRQKAEIERLKAENEGKDFYLDVEKDAHKMSIGIMEQYAKSIKAEAIKEFAERLKNGCGRVKTEGQSMLVCREFFFDNLVKEMVGKEQ